MMELEHPIEEAIKVMVRVRPLSAQDIEVTGAQSCVAVNNNTISVIPEEVPATAPGTPTHTPSSTPTRSGTPSRATSRQQTTPRRSTTYRLGTPSSQRSRSVTRTFTFDSVFDATATQEEVYQDVDPLVQAVIEGHNSTIFAYGQTGSGKTHTMLGTSKDPGIIPRAVDRLFQLVAAKTDTLFVVRCSFVELHLDHFNDLLDPARHPSQRAKQLPSARAPPPLELHEDSRTGRVYLTGSPYLDTTITSRTQALRLIDQGARIRTVASTQMNHISSRSHAILTFYVESRLSADPTAPVTMGKLHLVDLAGSERLARSQAEGNTKKETQNINSSLSALGDCLAALTSGKVEHVPYRNSKLTRLLADSLGGNSHTLFIVNVQQGPSSYTETLSSLLYAQRAKMIKNRISVNRDLFGCSDIQALQSEITRLKQHLQKRTQAYQAIRKQQAVMGKENEILRNQLAGLSAVNMREKDALEQQMGNVIHSTGELAEQQQAFLSLQASLDHHSKANHDLMVRLAVGEGDNLDLSQQLKAAQHEAAHARWERDRATHAVAKLRNKLKTAQSAWEEERKMVQTRILELEELLDKACTELKQRRKSKSPHQQQHDLALSLENEKKQVRLLLDKYKKLKGTSDQLATKHKEQMQEKDNIIRELKKALASSGYNHERENEPSAEETATEEKAGKRGRKKSRVSSVRKRRREEEDNQLRVREKEEESESPTEEDFDGTVRKKKRGKSSPHDGGTENECKEEQVGAARISEGNNSAEMDGKKGAGTRRLLPRISGMVDRKGATALGPLTRALLAKQTLPKLKNASTTDKENVAANG